MELTSDMKRRRRSASLESQQSDEVYRRHKTRLTENDEVKTSEPSANQNPLFQHDEDSQSSKQSERPSSSRSQSKQR